MVKFERRLSSYARRTWDSLETQRVLETGRRLREHGFQYRVRTAMRPTSIAGFSLLLSHSSFGILSRPVPPRRPAEAIIAEIERKYTGIFEEQLAAELEKLALEVTRQGLEELGKIF